MATSRKTPRTKIPPTTGSGDNKVPLAPVEQKIGEAPGNLKARSEAFKRRRGRSG